MCVCACAHKYIHMHADINIHMYSDFNYTLSVIVLRTVTNITIRMPRHATKTSPTLHIPQALHGLNVVFTFFVPWLQPI